MRELHTEISSDYMEEDMRSISVRLTDEEHDTLERLREETLRTFGIAISKHGLLKQAIMLGYKRIGRLTKDVGDGIVQ